MARQVATYAGLNLEDLFPDLGIHRYELIMSTPWLTCLSSALQVAATPVVASQSTAFW